MLDFSIERRDILTIMSKQPTPLALLTHHDFGLRGKQIATGGFLLAKSMKIHKKSGRCTLQVYLLY